MNTWYMSSYGRKSKEPRHDLSSHAAAWEKHWSGIVEQYSHRHLTRDSDKLIAIGSIASEVAIQIGEDARDIARCGMWMSRWPVELLWSIEKGIPRRLMPRSVPTWSWASLNGHITCNKSTFASKRIIPAFAAHDNEQTLGAIFYPDIGPLLEIRAWRRTIHAIRSVEKERPAGWRGRYALFGRELDADADSDSGLTVSKTPFALGDLDFSDRDGVISSLQQRQFVYVHLLHMHRHTGLILARHQGDGLPRDHSSVECYERVGAASLYGFGDELMESGESSEWNLDWTAMV